MVSDILKNFFFFGNAGGNPKGDGVPFWWVGIGSDERPLPRAKP